MYSYCVSFAEEMASEREMARGRTKDAGVTSEQLAEVEYELQRNRYVARCCLREVLHLERNANQAYPQNREKERYVVSCCASPFSSPKIEKKKGM